MGNRPTKIHDMNPLPMTPARFAIFWRIGRNNRRATMSFLYLTLFRTASIGDIIWRWQLMTGPSFYVAKRYIPFFLFTVCLYIFAELRNPICDASRFIVQISHVHHKSRTDSSALSGSPRLILAYTPKNIHNATHHYVTPLYTSYVGGI